MEYKQLPIKTIKPSKMNPPVRVKTIRKLVRNIELHGLLCPVIVDNKNVLIDGHRRLAAVKLLGWTKIPTIKHNSTSHQRYDDLFVATNEDTMLLNGNQYLWRYMKGAKIPETYLRRIENMEKYLGKSYAAGMFKQILVKKRSAATYQYAMGIYRKYTGKTSRVHMRKLAYYLLNVENSSKMRNAIHGFIPVDLLVNCVESKKKIKTVFDIGD